MKVKQSEIVKLFQDCGVQTSDKLTVERLQKRVESLPTFAESKDFKKPKSADSKVLLKKLIKAIEGEVDIEIIPTAKSNGAAAAKTSTKAKAKAAEAEEEEEEVEEEAEEEVEEEEEEEEEVEDEEEEVEDEEEEVEDEEEEVEDEAEEEEAPKKKKKVKKGASPVGRGPGIVKRIRELMEGTTADKPLTHDQIVDKLMKEFPGREAKALKKTTVGQVAYFLRPTNVKQKDPLNIVSAGVGKGFYVAKKGTAPPKKAAKTEEAEEAPVKKKKKVAK